ncbi:integrase-like protein [Murinocardiopsis flavida]|uniref:Integrase-like protein n=1 Tax=Murinocardiopsis flavida TaxID=645275 RepID=A0A2P8DHB9_9ACTN|nr:site-specific integrase [Murinocardiopsis flavida]PSK96615.1 integrase-like protein [Murinocardiopsis flavida]
MAYAEKRGNLWRARWRGPNGRLESEPGFTSKRAAAKYGRDQEAAIRNDTYVDPRSGLLRVTEWANTWFAALDLERTTLANYRYHLESHVLPVFGERELRSLTPEEIAIWERELQVSRRTAREARSVFTTMLNDAIPRYIKLNPAARKRGKGRKGQRRIDRAVQRTEKAWVSPFQALLLAERCALLSGHDDDFALVITAAYTAARWSELMGLAPENVRQGELDIHWKLYELDGHFYRGRPKDGSMRTVDLPPFLYRLLEKHLRSTAPRTCHCGHREEPWCAGQDYLFLTAQGGHHRRSTYSERTFRPAADGWYPERGGKVPRPARPVLVDLAGLWPGRPVAPWPPAVPGEPFHPPTGRGHARLVSGGDGRGRCSHCRRTQLLRLDGTLIRHVGSGSTCPGSGEPPAADAVLASWLPLRAGLTPHGLRHSHEPWMDDAAIPYVLQSERMGHEVPGMRGTYAHPTPDMRRALVAALERVWTKSLRARRAISERSAVPILDALLADSKGS